VNDRAAAQLKERYIFASVKTYYDRPLVLTDGEGCRVNEASGATYLDLFGGILTVSVGHANPVVVKAVTEQVRRISHTSTCYINWPMVEAARRLAEITPGRLQKTFFHNSGTEANELAVMAARCYTDNFEVVALRHSYHGRSSLATSLTGNHSWRPPASQPGIVFTHNAYCYRCPFKLTHPKCDLACAHNLEEMIKTSTSGHIAGIIAEPIQGVGGFITPPPGFFKIIAEIARHYGGIFISDEVQTGFGRTGTHMFGIQHWDVEPDIMTFAKGLGNGAPVGATIATPEVADSINFSTISTFGGNPVTMAAANATLGIITGQDLPKHVAKMGDLFFAGLAKLKSRYPFVGDVRGKGLMIGIELVEEDKVPSADLTTKLLNAAKDEGVLVGRGGLYGNVIRLTPPMTIQPAEVEEGLDKLGRACEKVANLA